MLFKYKPNYFLATGSTGLEFDNKGEFNTTEKWQEAILEEIGAVKVVAKKTTKK